MLEATRRLRGSDPLLRRVAAVSAIVLWLAAALILQGTVTANNWGSNIDHACDPHPESQCVAKKGSLKYWFNSNMHASKKQQTRIAAENQFNDHPYNNGKIILTEESTQSLSNIRIRQSNAGLNGAWAWGYCPDDSEKVLVGPKKRYCDPQLIVWNQDYSQYFDTDGKKRAIACQEFGHVYGLRHRSTDKCMTPLPNASNQELGIHEMRCLKLYYPTSTGGALDPDEPPDAQDCP